MASGPTIDWLVHPAFEGRIGLTHCPGGRVGPFEAELAEIQASGASALVTLVEGEELTFLGVPSLGELAEAAGLTWYHLPIVDFGVPDSTFERRWADAGPEILERLRAGEAVVIHCYAGLGRTGMIAARLLVDAGEVPRQAMRLVRKARVWV